MPILDLMLTIGILAFVGIMMYSHISNKTLTEIFKEFKDVIKK